MGEILPYWKQRQQLKLKASSKLGAPSDSGNSDNSGKKLQPKEGEGEDVEPKRIEKKAKTAPALKKSKIKNTSKKRAKQYRQYAPVKRKFLTDHPICQVEGCEAPSSDIHHKAGRSGKQLVKLEDFMAVCRPHHDTFEDQDKAAREAGHKTTRLGKAQKG